MIAMSVSADNRLTLQRRASEILSIILRWGNVRKLNFSSTKSVSVPIKGNLVPGFTISFGDTKIKSCKHAKYLGIIIDSERNYKEHVEYLRTKSLDLFTRMRGIFGNDCGMRRENAKTLYNCVFIPRIMYGVQFWYTATEYQKSKNTLGVVQRRALLGITSAYRTASTASLQVIAGTLPLDLEARLQMIINSTKELPEEG